MATPSSAPPQETQTSAPTVDLHALLGNDALKNMALQAMMPELPSLQGLQEDASALWSQGVETMQSAAGGISGIANTVGKGLGQLTSAATQSASDWWGDMTGSIGMDSETATEAAATEASATDSALTAESTTSEPTTTNPSTENANAANQAAAIATGATAGSGDVLTEGLALERQVEAMPAVSDDGTVKGYHHNTPTPSEQADGAYNCTVYVTSVLEAAGYDVNQLVTVGGVTAPISDFINIRAESASAEHLAEGEAFTIVLPELATSADPAATLQNLVKSDDPRTKGVVAALTAGPEPQGTEIVGMDNLRPGDLIQGWRSDNKTGHATIVHRVHHKTGVLDENSTPDASVYDVTKVELLGAHYPIDNNGHKVEKDEDGVRAGDSVYTKPATNLSEYPTWYAVRANGSAWPLP